MNDPYWNTAAVPSFEVTSPDLASGDPLPQWARSGILGAGGEDRSPALAWSGAPAATRSFLVTCFDPDAPTFSGWWHWVVANVPPTTVALPRNAGDPASGLLPEGAVQLPNDARLTRYLGAAPPSGHGVHRYFFTVSALDVEHLDVPADAAAALVAFTAAPHVIARGTLIGTTFTA